MNVKFVCPICKTGLQIAGRYFTCQICNIKYPISQRIPNLIPKYQLDSTLTRAQKEYEQAHKISWHRVSDGSYEILAAIARGNKTLDIACGEGFLEEFAPRTLGFEFSRNALLKAQRKGITNLVQGVAEYLPFADDEFAVSINAGSLEHFSNPQKAISEMVRVSKIQVLTVHAYPTIPFANELHTAATKLLRLTHQPIEQPISSRLVRKWLENNNAKVVFDGLWHIPLNYGRIVAWLPEIKSIPTCTFVISIKM